jgi:hypothetical protein
VVAISTIVPKNTCGWSSHASLAIFAILKCGRKIEDRDLNAWVEKIEVTKWLWGAYGPGEENFVFTYLDKDGEPQGCKDHDSLL